MAVTAPADAHDAFVSIEKFVFADAPHAGTSTASTLQGTVFTAAALTNVATFFGLNGQVNVGTFDGSAARAGAASGQEPGWVDAILQGLQSLQQKLQAAPAGEATQSAAAGASSAADDWVVLSGGGAAPAPADAAAEVKPAPKIDWKGVLTSFAAPLFSRVAAAKPAQPNIADFKARAPGKSEP
jgi:hypothetical protein